jgi:hypothetical protein
MYLPPHYIHMFLQVLNLIKQLTFNFVLIFAYICDKWFIGTSYCLITYLLLNSQPHITQKSLPPFLVYRQLNNTFAILFV